MSARRGIVLAAALAFAAWRVVGFRWTSDDAFLSFRCARNLVEGLGPVFNAGERVEVFTNPLWTLWAAVGLKLGFAAESWANAWGAICYLATIVLLAVHRRGDPRDPWIPLAALGAALHRDWAVFATGGLETSALTFLVTAGFVLVVGERDRAWGPAAAGAVFALAAMTRHDAVLFAAVAGVFVLVRAGHRRRDAALFAAAFAVLWVPFTLARVAYYGDLFPNSYYAKSGSLAWYGQGLRYLWLYVEKYWVLFVGLPLVPVFARRDRRALLAAAIAGVYGFWVIRVGGDFMFARFLIPVTPFLLIVLEAVWVGALAGRPRAAPAVAAALLALMVVMPDPIRGAEFRWGVADERSYYDPRRIARLDHEAEVLGRFFEGLPARVAFYGDEARVVYKARFPVAIEAHAGLTEPEIARRPLGGRGRPGHEKHAPAEYLILKRKAHITFSREPRRLIAIDERIPRVYVRFDEQVHGQLLHWDPRFAAELVRRGADVQDFLRELDRLIAGLDRRSAAEVGALYRRLRLFYFDHVDDPAREESFRRRLAGEAREP